MEGVVEGQLSLALEMLGFGVVLQMLMFDVVVMKTFEVCGCVACGLLVDATMSHLH